MCCSDLGLKHTPGATIEERLSKFLSTYRITPQTDPWYLPESWEPAVKAGSAAWHYKTTQNWWHSLCQGLLQYTTYLDCRQSCEDNRPTLRSCSLQTCGCSSSLGSNSSARHWGWLSTSEPLASYFSSYELAQYYTNHKMNSSWGHTLGT